ncbi:MAG: membrane protein insertase YidC [PVC group bacterium]|nr:membrane protein insertase YidC [PVC group bacterium]
MNKDKNFIKAIIITVVVLFLYPKIMMRFFPQMFPAPEQNPKTHTTETIKQQTVINETESASTDSSSGVTYSKENSYVLENDTYRITVNSPQADVQKVELQQFIDPQTQQPTVVLDAEEKQRGVFATPELVDKAQLEDVISGSDKIIFIYKDLSGLTIKKTIELEDNTHIITLDIEIINESLQDQTVSYRMTSAAGIAPAEGIASRYQEILTILETEKRHKQHPGKVKKETLVPGAVKIAAFKTRYFSLAAIPFINCDYTYSYKNNYSDAQQSPSFGLGIDKQIIPAQGKKNHAFALYVGPNDSETMAISGLGIEEIRGKGVFAGFSDFLLSLLRWLHGIFNNYGLAVIALSLVLQTFLYPLTFKSLKSMKDMQALQPQVEEMRNKYKDDAQKLNKEIMELYKNNKVNPLGGCLPMLLQMPVFFSLYKVLMQAVELRGAQFWWIKDLSGPDALIVFSNTYPLIGNTFNILPVVMIAASFLQQKMTNPNQANEQQKMMALIMPVFLGAIFYRFPSGLVLYFLTNTIFSLVMQGFMASRASVAKEE